jgi:hypothetical protein
MRNAVVITHGVGDHAEMLRISDARHRAWCKQHRMDFVQSFERRIPTRNPMWEKIPLIRDALEAYPAGSLVVWLDSDVIVRHLECDPRKALPKGADMAFLRCTTREGRKIWNTGMFFVRVSALTNVFFAAVWSRGPVPGCDLRTEHPKHDEARLNYELANFPQLKVHGLSARWNDFWDDGPDPIIRAWHDRPNTTVRRRMEEEIAALAAGTPVPHRGGVGCHP